MRNERQSVVSKRRVFQNGHNSFRIALLNTTLKITRIKIGAPLLLLLVDLHHGQLFPRQKDCRRTNVRPGVVVLVSVVSLHQLWVKVPVSVIGPFIVIEAGLFVPV
jgi:hypothetical protein